MNREERREWDRWLKKVGDQRFPSGRVVVARDMRAVLILLRELDGLGAVADAVGRGTPEALAGVESVVESCLVAVELGRRNAPTALGESD